MNAPPSSGTPLRNVRVPDDLWAAAQRVAAEQGTTVSAVIVDRLRRYVRNHDRRQRRRPEADQ